MSDLDVLIAWKSAGAADGAATVAKMPDVTL